MTDDNPVFRALWRFNAVAIAAAACLAALGAAMVVAMAAIDVVGGSGRPVGVPAPERSAAEDDSQREEEAARITPFQPLGRTGAFYAVVLAPRLSAGETALVGSYRAKQKAAVDWLIYDPAAPDAQARHLIGAAPSLLLDAHLVRLETGRTPEPELFLFARYVVEDGDGDGRLTEDDPEVLAIAEPDGTELTPLPLEGAFHSLQPIDADEAVVFLSRDGAIVAAHVEIRSRRVLRETLLPQRSIGP